MTLIFGFLTVMGLVFGGFVLAGGKFDIILHALPFEGMMIGGAAIGSFVIANSVPVMKQSLQGVGKVMKGNKWKAADYADLLSLMFELTTFSRVKGGVALDAHIEDPQNSEIFKRYPKIAEDHHAMDMITGTFRLQNLGLENSMDLDDKLSASVKKHHHEVLAPAHAIQTMADALPAIGIVAAVLGVIKTMASIDKPPSVLGGMIGGALVGTFLGVFLAYTLVAPIASRLTQIEEEDSKFYEVIKEIFIAFSKEYPPVIAIEMGREAIPGKMIPSFEEVEQTQQSLPKP